MSELTHLSYSSISAYQLCPRSWYYKYIEKVPTVVSPSLVFGSAFHNAVEDIIRHRVRGESRAPYEIWSERWGQATEQEIAWNGERPEELSNMGLRMLTAPDAQQAIAQIEPLIEDGEPAIERRVELRVPDVPIPIIGYIDVILADGTVADFKTAARAWAPDKAQSEMQPLFYIAALTQAGYIPSYQAQHIVFTKTKKPQVQILDTKRTIAEVFGVLRTIRDVWRGIEAESFPQNMQTWKCSSKWCDYYQICRGV